jgi:hypothetical protein
MTREIEGRSQRVRARTRPLQVLVAVFTLACASPAFAVPIGVLSFDTLIPGPDGVNSFNIANLTDAFGLPPDFPVVDSLTFTDAQLTAIDSNGNTALIDLGDIAPGFADNAGLFFPDTTLFISATLTFTLSSLQFLLADGSTFDAASSLISVSLVPSAGNSLSPGDLVVIDVASAPVSTVPEPGTLMLFGTGVLTCCRIGRRRMKAS